MGILSVIVLLSSSSLFLFLCCSLAALRSCALCGQAVSGGMVSGGGRFGTHRVAAVSAAEATSLLLTQVCL
eukprot:COSAG01_NODE_1182_length_11347_cov_7.504356_2_plen_71_part_00